MDTTRETTPITLQPTMNQTKRKELRTGKTQDPQHITRGKVEGKFKNEVKKIAMKEMETTGKIRQR